MNARSFKQRSCFLCVVMVVGVISTSDSAILNAVTAVGGSVDCNASDQVLYTCKPFGAQLPHDRCESEVQIAISPMQQYKDLHYKTQFVCTANRCLNEQKAKITAGSSCNEVY